MSNFFSVIKEQASKVETFDKQGRKTGTSYEYPVYKGDAPSVGTQSEQEDSKSQEESGQFSDGRKESGKKVYVSTRIPVAPPTIDPTYYGMSNVEYQTDGSDLTSVFATVNPSSQGLFQQALVNALGHMSKPEYQQMVDKAKKLVPQKTVNGSGNKSTTKSVFDPNMVRDVGHTIMGGLSLINPEKKSVQFEDEFQTDKQGYGLYDPIPHSAPSGNVIPIDIRKGKG